MSSTTSSVSAPALASLVKELPPSPKAVPIASVVPQKAPKKKAVAAAKASDDDEDDKKSDVEADEDEDEKPVKKAKKTTRAKKQETPEQRKLREEKESIMKNAVDKFMALNCLRKLAMVNPNSKYHIANAKQAMTKLSVWTQKQLDIYAGEDAPCLRRFLDNIMASQYATDAEFEQLEEKGWTADAVENCKARRPKGKKSGDESEDDEAPAKDEKKTLGGRKSLADIIVIDFKLNHPDRASVLWPEKATKGRKGAKKAATVVAPVEQLDDTSKINLIKKMIAEAEKDGNAKRVKSLQVSLDKIPKRKEPSESSTDSEAPPAKRSKTT